MMILTTAALCLALNIYHEARSEPLIGQHAVAQVTMNRAGRDPSKVCEVVFQPKQFSWANPLTTVEGALRLARVARFMPKNMKAWAIAKTIAINTVAGNVRDFTSGARFYHTKAVKPKWSRKAKPVRVYGEHVFYAQLSVSQ